MDTATAEALGREALALGFEIAGEGHEVLRLGFDERGFPISVPDFRDELTALACIPWVRSVATKAYGAYLAVTIGYGPGGVVVRIELAGDDGDTLCHGFGPTLAHACIAAVRAAQGGST